MYVLYWLKEATLMSSYRFALNFTYMLECYFLSLHFHFMLQYKVNIGFKDATICGYECGSFSELLPYRLALSYVMVSYS